jgi:hypothetical protein
MQEKQLQQRHYDHFHFILLQQLEKSLADLVCNRVIALDSKWAEKQQTR